MNVIAYVLVLVYFAVMIAGCIAALWGLWDYDQLKNRKGKYGPNWRDYQ